MGPSKESSLESIPPYSENRDALTPPITLVLDNQTIHLGSDSSTPLYHLSQSITALQTQGEPSSIRLDSVSKHEKAGSTGGSTTTNLFHLVHPINARYRSDTPAYYATGNPSSTASNFLLQPSTSKNPLHKPEFTVLASPGRNAASADLFADPKDQRTLLTAKQKWTSGRCVWRSGEGKAIAIEEGEKTGEGPRRKIIINEALEKETMDALVAAWCLRCWYDVAESKEMTKRRLDAMTPPESISGVAMKWPKRTGAMAGLGAGGGGM